MVAGARRSGSGLRSRAPADRRCAALGRRADVGRPDLDWPQNSAGATAHGALGPGLGRVASKLPFSISTSLTCNLRRVGCPGRSDHRRRSRRAGQHSILQRARPGASCARKGTGCDQSVPLAVLARRSNSCASGLAWQSSQAGFVGKSGRRGDWVGKTTACARRFGSRIDSGSRFEFGSTCGTGHTCQWRTVDKATGVFTHSSHRGYTGSRLAGDIRLPDWGRLGRVA